MTAVSELALRAFAPDRDYPGVVDLISATNLHDRGQDWYPTVESLRIDWATTPSFDPARDAIVVEAGGRIVAGGMVDWRERAGKIIHTNTIWVLPEVRRRGLGGQVLTWLEAHARASVAEGSGGSRDLPHFLGAGVDTAHAAGVRFAERAGYAQVRYGFQMRRPLDLPIPEIALPDGLEVRPQSAADAAQLREGARDGLS
jgi:GNAT superfamily N-acetyltransferase